MIDQWFTHNIQFWNDITPAIQTNNKLEDLKKQYNLSIKGSTNGEHRKPAPDRLIPGASNPIQADVNEHPLIS